MSISLKAQNHTCESNQFFHSTVGEGFSGKVFSFCILFIVSVSIYDTYLVSIYREGILASEKNPICLYLIRQDMSHLSWFIGGKVLGNVAVVAALLGLYWLRFRHALTVAKAIAWFQLSLLAYLHTSDALTGLFHFDDLSSNVPAKFEAALFSLLLHLAVMVTMISGGLFAKRKWEHMRSALIH